MWLKKEHLHYEYTSDANIWLSDVQEGDLFDKKRFSKLSVWPKLWLAKNTPNSVKSFLVKNYPQTPKIGFKLKSPKLKHSDNDKVWMI